MTRRAVIALGVVLLLAAVVVGVARMRAQAPAACGASVTSLSARESRTPFLDAAGQREQPDEDRDRAVASLGTGALGEVVGAVGYHYEQWAQLSAFAHGIGVRTRNNPDFTMLDDQTLRPRWSVQVDTRRSTYDADDSTYLVATMPRSGSPDLVALDADTGERRWCRSLGGGVRDADPFATQMLDDGVVVAGPGEGSRLRVTRVGVEGRSWTRELDGDRGDYLGGTDDGLLVLGGRSTPELADASLARPAGVAVRALDPQDGHTAWRHEVAAGTAVHVVGTSGSTTVLDQRVGTSAPALVALGRDGREAWSVEPDLGASIDTAVRSGRVLVRGASRWAAYDASTGRPLWRVSVPDRPQLLPYGFTLATLPLLDDDTALVGTTTGLRTLDLRSGRLTVAAPLPADGVSTTYWPYQVAVSPGLVAVATNTSAVLLRRR